MIASWSLAGWIAWDTTPAARTILALVAGTLAISLVATGIATIAPKHGMALTIMYMLFFDMPVGILPASIREISIGRHVEALAFRDPNAAALGLCAISVVWALIAALRIRRLEA